MAEYVQVKVAEFRAVYPDYWGAFLELRGMNNNLASRGYIASEICFPQCFKG
jgi:hypothetical protein